MVSSDPKLLPSSLNWTPATPILSEAEAATVTEEPDTGWPLSGEVIDTVGKVVSGAGSTVRVAILLTALGETPLDTSQV